MFVDTLFEPMLRYPREVGQRPEMNVLRCTVIDRAGAVSFLTHGDALPALVAACTVNPDTVDEFLDRVEPFYQNLSDYVHDGLAVFDEHNARGHYEEIHRLLMRLPRHKQPVFRVVDDLTREASLRPVKAGAVIFNLKAKRIVQMVNSYQEIRRSGRGRVFDGARHTETVFQYRLPEEWALVP
jgi:hypothetical protein